MNNDWQSWWFENQYGKSVIAINCDHIIISFHGISAFSLKKQRDNNFTISNIKKVIIKKPIFWQVGYLYLVLKNEKELTAADQILLTNTCLPIKRNSEWKQVQAIKIIIDNFLN